MRTNGGSAAPEKGPWVADLEESMEFIGCYVARNPRLYTFRDPGRGKYMWLQLVDITGVIEARMWEGAEEVFDQVGSGGPIKARAVYAMEDWFRRFVGWALASPETSHRIVELESRCRLLAQARAASRSSTGFPAPERMAPPDRQSAQICSNRQIRYRSGC